MALFGYDTAGLASFYESNKTQVDKTAQMVLGAAETTYTFAKLDAAKGAGTGFGGGTARLDGFAAMNG